VSVEKPDIRSGAPLDSQAAQLEVELLEWIRTAPAGFVTEGPTSAARYGLDLEAAARLDRQFETLALRVFEHQFARVPVYRAYCAAVGRTPAQVRAAAEIPALPVEAFKRARIATFPAGHERIRFHTSGTTADTPGVLHLDALALYDLALERGFQHHVLPDRDRIRMLTLVPHPDEAPHSSLAYMLERVRWRWGDAGSATLWRNGEVRWDQLRAAFVTASDEGVAVCVLATSFTWVHVLDACAAEDFSLRLPAGSRAFETGGTKGRSRDLDRDALRQQIHHRLGIPASHVVGEYGMTELGSQMYTLDLRHALRGEPPGDGTWSAPAWLRPRLLDADTAVAVDLPAATGTGLLALHDLANRCSVAHLLTADLGTARGASFELAGRCPRAERRGCGLVHEDWEVRR
jgi:hypothetical protein